ncbi:hypothetical protein [Legionella gresilensis]|uniref:hypothetical protein n=1 Tax=Legionella gresilensis TaxID=91823 RepID=UPI00104189A9|nr:hypothetical protein [Legionella gresilensis]
MQQSWLKNIICLACATVFSGQIYSSTDELSLNDGLPIMVDSRTQLNDIHLKDDTVTFTYQIKDINVDQALEIKEDNKAIIEQNACDDEQIKDLFCKNFNVNFVYWIQDKKILEVPVDKQLCRTRQSQIA